MVKDSPGKKKQEREKNPFLFFSFFFLSFFSKLEGGWVRALQVRKRRERERRKIKEKKKGAKMMRGME